jgi:hypothetical protein
MEQISRDMGVRKYLVQKINSIIREICQRYNVMDAIYGHYKRDFPKIEKKRKKRHHASAANNEEPSNKDKHEETNFFYYSGLTGSFEDDMWLIDNGAS